MKFIALAISLLSSITLRAQDSTRIFIAAGKRLADVITPQVMYRYKEFKPGRVLFKDGNFHNARLNYNLLNGEVMFIAPGGDTLAIAKEQKLNIKLVSIDTNLYVYDKGYLEVIRENKNATLARTQQYFVVSREKIGGYGIASATSTIDSYSSITDQFDNRRNLIVRENISLQLKTEYYIGDPYNLFLRVNKKNLQKIFFKKRNELESYLREHTVDLQNEKQIVALFTFLTDTP